MGDERQMFGVGAMGDRGLYREVREGVSVWREG